MRENQKANHKLVKKCLNYAFSVERQEIFFHTSNNVRPLIIAVVKKLKNLIIPAYINRGFTVISLLETL